MFGTTWAGAFAWLRGSVVEYCAPRRRSISREFAFDRDLKVSDLSEVEAVSNPLAEILDECRR